MRKDILSITILASSVVFASLYIQERGKRLVLQQELTSFKGSVGSYSTQRSAAQVEVVEKAANTTKKSEYPSSPGVPSSVSKSLKSSTLSPPSPQVDEIEFFSSMKVRNIEKFIPLSEDQKLRLADRFRSDALAEDLDAPRESVDEILGSENAKYLENMRSEARQRAKFEKTEKDVLFLSRNLGLSSTEESALRSALYETNHELVKWLENNPPPNNYKESREESLRFFIRKHKAYREIKDRMLKESLSKESYLAYLEEEANSASGDIELWHSLE